MRVRRWIRLDSSMTIALRQAYGSGVGVAVLRDAPGALLADEADALGTARTCAHIREVALRDEQQIWLVARTVYLRRAQGKPSALTGLGPRPLGELLFAAMKPRWRLREYARLHARMPLYALLRQARGCVSAPSWARRTVFLFENQPLLVTEVFMPAMFRPASACAALSPPAFRC